MRFSMKKLIISLAIFSSIVLQAANLEFAENYEELALVNLNNQKIYTYYVLQPGSSISYQAEGIETMSIITRVVLNGKEKVEYDYDLEIGDEGERIRKNATRSSVTKGVSGEMISGYNRVKLDLNNLTRKITVTNLSSQTLLFKFNIDSPQQSGRSYEFVSITPDTSGSVETLLMDGREYDYYTLGEDGINLKLEGPIALKVISRYIFESTFINTNNYRFRIFDNGQLIERYTEEAYKSDKALLKSDETKIPSTGNVNIIELEEGMHEISIQNGSINRDVIFRLFISKSAIKIEEE